MTFRLPKASPLLDKRGKNGCCTRYDNRWVLKYNHLNYQEGYNGHGGGDIVKGVGLRATPMPAIIITTEGVARLLHGLNPNKATGPDDIPARILQLTANELAPALHIIFQKSLDTGKLPLSWS